MSDWSSDVCSSDLYLQLVIFGEDDAAALIVDDTLHDIVEIGRVLVEDRAEEAEFGNVMIVLVVRQPAFGYPRCISAGGRSEEHTSELQSLMSISYAVFCLKKKTRQNQSYI